MNIAHYIICIYLAKVQTQLLSSDFPEWNPFKSYCEFLFPDQRNLNITSTKNNAGNEIIVLQCGENYVGVGAGTNQIEQQNQVNFSTVHDYQQEFIDDEIAYLQNYGFKMSGEAVVMDHGADVSGAPLSYLVSKFGCKAVGYNIFGFYSENQVQNFVHLHQNVNIVLGNAEKRIPFKQNVFDIVLSANVLEHVEDYQRYLSESIRVLKRGGGLFITWGPQFYGIGGHHIHPDMLKTWWEVYECGGEFKGVTEGWVGPWDHLLLNPSELRWKLSQSALGACTKVIDEVVSRVFCHSDINRRSYEDVLNFLQSLQDIEILMVELKDMNVDKEIEEKLVEKVGDREFGVFQVKIIIKKM
eukprot:TRINITY_DN1432_c0_g2_i1.p1 TRINITY_DN1432_c0_g2~~TRINITY_DN1432_c0_g2_i1.p1  ORF type:complete len:356 (-),score=55.00 TRINITY_DN1432_c0_g2_i1:92-1159(-)